MMNEMLKESNHLMKAMMKSIDDNTSRSDLDIIDRIIALQQNQIKIINSAISAYGIQSKNKRAISGLENQNIMDDTTAIDILPFEPDNEKVKCPLFDNIISRAECLDYSGSNNDDCINCYIGKKTKKKLLSTKFAVYTESV